MVRAGCPFDVEGWEEHLKDLGQRKRKLVEKLNEVAPERPEAEPWN
jgi:hypothetical protein